MHLCESVKSLGDNNEDQFKSNTKGSKKNGINICELYHFFFSGVAFITLIHTLAQCRISKPNYIE